LAGLIDDDDARAVDGEPVRPLSLVERN